MINVSETKISYNTNLAIKVTGVRALQDGTIVGVDVTVWRVTACVSHVDCSSNQFCEFPVCSAQTGSCKETPVTCPTDYNPVCGCNGVTYSNDCVRASNKASKRHDGVCTATTTTIPAQPSLYVSHSPPNPSVFQNISLTATVGGPVPISEMYINITLDGSVVKTCNFSPCTYQNSFAYTGTHTYYADAYLVNPPNFLRDPPSGTKSFIVSDSVTTTTTIPPVVCPADSVPQIVNLVHGWNAFSLFVQNPDDYTVQNVLDDINTQGGQALEIDKWDPETGNWVGHPYGVPFGNFEIKLGEGYLVKTSKYSKWTICGQPRTQTLPVSLFRGYNFVSFPYMECSLTAESLCQEAKNQGHDIKEISRWDSETGNWGGHICGLSFGNFHIKNSEPYFIKTENDNKRDYIPCFSPTGQYFTVSVCNEMFEIFVTDYQTIQDAIDNFYRRNDKFVDGDLEWGDGGFNQPWSWHLVPDSVRMVDNAIELCDGCPTDVESNIDYWMNEVGGYCPWSSRIISMHPGACPTCGDGKCDNQWESECNCQEDCGSGSCLSVIPTCGNGECEILSGERYETCPQDCAPGCVPSPEILSSAKCKNSCLYNNMCIPIGTRVKVGEVSSYCSVDGTVKPQVTEGEACLNDYECKTNDCSNDKCVSTYNLLQKIWEAIRDIFSFGR